MGCMKWCKGMALGPDFIASCTSQRPKAFERPIVNMLNIYFVISESWKSNTHDLETHQQSWVLMKPVQSFCKV